MSKRTAKDAIKKIAKREGRSESEIREEIEKVIMIGFLNKETRPGEIVCLDQGGCQVQRNLLQSYH
ncbi:MAG: hypothetical protein NC489_40285 [Ruminococcus flavefaciens]|nr:hypothetical protein [Ruminococcus flavefaciens]